MDSLFLWETNIISFINYIFVRATCILPFQLSAIAYPGVCAFVNHLFIYLSDVQQEDQQEAQGEKGWDKKEWTERRDIRKEL